LKRRIVVFSPHPDDETLGCGGTIAKKITEGFEVIIIVMTDGRYAFSKLLGIKSNPTPIELKEIRKKELIKAAKILGVKQENLLFLDFVNGDLKKNQLKAEKKIIEILKRTLPAEVYYPHERDEHPDHRVTNRLVKNSIKKLKLDVTGYEYLIYPKFLNLNLITERILNFFKRNIIWIDISEFLPLKKKAIKEFKSQISIISKKQKKPVIDEIERFLKNEEKFYIMNIGNRYKKYEEYSNSISRLLKRVLLSGKKYAK